MMCFILLQHYIHCKHTDAYFKTCWEGQINGTNENFTHTGGPRRETRVGHNEMRAEIHSFNRCCPTCWAEAFAGVASYEDYHSSSSEDSDAERDVCQLYPSALDVMNKARNLHQSERVAFSFSGNVNFEEPPFDGYKIAMLRDESIDHVAALLEERTVFLSTPGCKTHLEHQEEHREVYHEEYQEEFDPEYSEPYQEDYEAEHQAEDQAEHMVEDTDTVLRLDGHELMKWWPPNVTKDTKEILVHFQDCGHLNTFFCPVLDGSTGDYLAPCGCSGFDKHLVIIGYAESRATCLACQVARPEVSAQALTFFNELVKHEIPKQVWQLWPEFARPPAVEFR